MATYLRIATRRRARRGASSSRPRLGGGFALGCAKPSTMHALASSGAVARRPSPVTGGAARCGWRYEARSSASSLHVLAWVEARRSQTDRSSPDDGELQRYRRPMSFTPSWDDSYAARRPAHKQEHHGDASRRRRSITGKRPRGRKGKDGHSGAHVGSAV
jgi:hypothetical protein